jgi:DNA (cytosine-5)-methyltransferase 1
MKLLSTFTGIGGLDFGLEKMGVEVVGFSEIRESSIRIYNKNYPGRKNFGDITKIDPKELPDFDIMTGGFPCQSFSIAGSRKGFSDRRGQMIFFIYDILMEKKPEFVVLENVKGIMTHDKGKTYENVFKILSSAGYSVRCVLLNSANYGSAQARERVLFLCRRGKDFTEKNPEVIDNSNRFRDIRDSKKEEPVFLSDKTMDRLVRTKGKKGFELVGGYDRVNTLTTGVSSSGRNMLVVCDQRKGEEGRLRRVKCIEAERLQGFPDGWTEGERTADRWFALGNAVNCNVSDYIFNVYLKGLWW